jgi:uncharacterized integral membrane protein (TIGR00698 family)
MDSAFNRFPELDDVVLNELREKFSSILPGFAISVTIGLAASFLSEHYGAPAMLFALLLGMALSFLYDDSKCGPGIDFSAATVLRIGVALLGFRIVLADILAIGWHPVLLMAVAIVSTILFGVLVARLIGLPHRFGGLTGGAVAICGASAAMAISAVLPDGKDKDQNTVFTIVGVTALSTLAMITYPIIAALLNLSDSEAGIFIGGTIHDVAQVVGAGYSISPEAGDLATLTKLIRVALLMPVVLAFALVLRRAGRVSARTPVLPGFLVAFVVIVFANSFLPLPTWLTGGLTSFSRTCLITSIAAIGLKSDLRKLAQVGVKPVLLMVLETLWLAAVVLLCLFLTR